jgi:hypothetical protein
MCCCSEDTLQLRDLHVLKESGILGSEEQLMIVPSGLYWLCCVHDVVVDQDLMLYQKLYVVLHLNHVLVAFDEKFHNFH